jgi:hypothetical protein
MRPVCRCCPAAARWARRRPDPTLLRRPLRLRFLSDAGAESFKRLLPGAAAVALVGHSLFPDERDFRILMAESVGRTEIFGAKLAALLVFASVFAVGAYAALLPLFGLCLVGPLGSAGGLPRIAAYSVACLVADVFAALAVVALHGVLVLIAPPARLVAMGTGVRSVLLCLLVLALPMIARLPASASAWTHSAWWLAWAPPAWFTMLERWRLAVQTNLAFEDDLPTEVSPLRLNVD